MISTPVPRFTRSAINEMMDQLLTMNLDKEHLLSTGSVTERRERLMHHFYPTTHSDATLPTQPKMCAKPKYTRSEINIMRVGLLKSELAALNLPVDGGGVGVLRPRLKAALYPPNSGQIPLSQPGVPGSASYGLASQPNPGQLPLSQLGVPGSANYGSASQPIPSLTPSDQVQAEGREQWNHFNH